MKNTLKGMVRVSRLAKLADIKLEDGTLTLLKPLTAEPGSQLLNDTGRELHFVYSSGEASYLGIGGELANRTSNAVVW